MCESETAKNHEKQEIAEICASERKCVVDRYFSRKYKTDVKGHIGEDHCILLHSNRICIITVSASHPIIVEKKRVRDISFINEKGVNRLENKASGKRKRGAQNLTETSELCTAYCEDGTQYSFFSCMKGSLVEVNENLIQNPNLIIEKPETDGYLAIVLSRLQDYNKEINKLQSEEQYQRIIQLRHAAAVFADAHDKSITTDDVKQAQITSPCLEDKDSIADVSEKDVKKHSAERLDSNGEATKINSPHTSAEDTAMIVSDKEMNIT